MEEKVFMRLYRIKVSYIISKSPLTLFAKEVHYLLAREDRMDFIK
jgi:hypothetical protein